MNVPPLSQSAPRRGGAFTRGVGRTLLAALRMRVTGSVPDVPRVVLVAAPHTSNWDFVAGVAAKLALGLRVRWLGKHTLFRGPLGLLLKFLGGLPVDRAAADGVVDAAVRRFALEERLYLAIAPEGTRRKVSRWKSGFHRIAQGADVPILPVAIDWGGREVRLLPLFSSTADLDADIARLRGLFAPEMARRPEWF